MPAIEPSIQNEDGTKTVYFEPSVPMSTYLACFIVSDFKNQSKDVNEDVHMRVFATPAQVDKVRKCGTRYDFINKK